MGLSKKDKTLILIIFAVIFFLFIMQSFTKDKGKSRCIDLEDLYAMFKGVNELEDYMDFTINLDGCRIKGEFKGNHFREVLTSGDHELCKEFEVTLGSDPNRFTDKIVRTDIINRINRLQNKKDCKGIIHERPCNKIPKCEWEKDLQKCGIKK